jgi:hypothetical protein
MSRSWPITLAAVTALLALMVWEVHSFTGPELAEAPRRSPVPSPVHDVPEQDANELARAWVSTAAERPLFRENRRPREAANDPAPETDEPLRLVGVIAGPFGNRAIFKSAKQAKLIVMMEGARMGNLMVRSIKPGQAVVELSGNIRMLRPSFADAPVPSQR